MGLLANAQWQNRWYDTKPTGGRFVRKDAAFRDGTADGSASPGDIGGFKAQAGRYHLYVSLACPWAHRTLIVRALKGLEDMMDVSVVHGLMLENGWTFADGPGVVADRVNHAKLLYQVYTRPPIRMTVAASRRRSCETSSGPPSSTMRRRKSSVC